MKIELHREQENQLDARLEAYRQHSADASVHAAALEGSKKAAQEAWNGFASIVRALAPEEEYDLTESEIENGVLILRKQESDEDTDGERTD